MTEFTQDNLNEIILLVKTLSPKTPKDLSCIRGVTGLNIMKSPILPSTTIMVSEDVFDKIYEASVDLSENNEVRTLCDS